MNTFHSILYKYQSAPKMAEHDYKNVFLKSEIDLKALGYNIPRATILIVGCGYTYPEVIFYDSVAEFVVGIDIIKTFWTDNIRGTYAFSASVSHMPIFRIFLTGYQYMFCKRYFKLLTDFSGLQVKHKKYKLVSSSGEKLPFKDETFDIVMSNAVIEHINALQVLFEEIRRVTKDNGLSYHLWHNYCSFSGNHLSENLNLKHPWGHLRGMLKASSGLNKLRLRQIENVFRKYFKNVMVYPVDKNHNKKDEGTDFELERRSLLTKRIGEELRDYSEDELLTRAYLIIGQKG
jgi:SAM-dependent methyltransferase